MRVILLWLTSLVMSTPALAQSELSCTAFVYGDMPFVTIQMRVKPDGHIERLANLIHHGTTRQTAIEENATSANQLYNLTVEADYPGQELFLEIYKPEDGETGEVLNGQLTNPEAPSYKHMRALCESK